MDMEMIQFHPTGMIYPVGVRGLLVTEAVRGEGGILTNIKGERFMEKYDPKRKELSARDVVARSIYTEITEGRGTANGAVYLDIRQRGPDYIKKKLPSMPTFNFLNSQVSISPRRGWRSRRPSTTRWVGSGSNRRPAAPA